MQCNMHATLLKKIRSIVLKSNITMRLLNEATGYKIKEAYYFVDVLE